MKKFFNEWFLSIKNGRVNIVVACICICGSMKMINHNTKCWVYLLGIFCVLIGAYAGDKREAKEEKRIQKRVEELENDALNSNPDSIEEKETLGTVSTLDEAEYEKNTHVSGITAVLMCGLAIILSIRVGGNSIGAKLLYKCGMEEMNSSTINVLAQSISVAFAVIAYHMERKQTKGTFSKTVQIISFLLMLFSLVVIISV